MSLTGSDAQAAAKSRGGGRARVRGGERGERLTGVRIEVDMLDDGTATAGQYDPGAGRDQCAQDGLRQAGGRSDRPADERRGQGDVADPQPGRSGDDHADLHQPRHHRPEICRAVPAGRQGDLFPHRDDRCLPGPEHGEYYRRYTEGEDASTCSTTAAPTASASPMRSRRRRKKGIKVLGRDQLNPKEADYTTTLTKIKSLNPTRSIMAA